MVDTMNKYVGFYFHSTYCFLFRLYVCKSCYRISLFETMPLTVIWGVFSYLWDFHIYLSFFLIWDIHTGCRLTHGSPAGSLLAYIQEEWENWEYQSNKRVGVITRISYSYSWSAATGGHYCFNRCCVWISSHSCIT